MLEEAHLGRVGSRCAPLSTLLLLALLTLEHLDLLATDPAPDTFVRMSVLDMVVRSADRPITRKWHLPLAVRLQIGPPFGFLRFPLLVRVALLFLPQKLLDDRSDAVDLVAECRESVLEILYLGLESVRLVRGGRSGCRGGTARDPESVERLLLRREGGVEMGILSSQRGDDSLEICARKSVLDYRSATERRSHERTLTPSPLVAEQNLHLAPNAPRLLFLLATLVLTVLGTSTRRETGFELGDASGRSDIVALESLELGRQAGERLGSEVGCTDGTESQSGYFRTSQTYNPSSHSDVLALE